MFELKTPAGTLISALSLSCASLLLVGCNDDSDKNAADPVKTDADYRQLATEILADLSLSEKLDIVAGPGMDLSTYSGNVGINLPEGAAVNGVAGYINGVLNDKLDLPAVKLADGPAGVRIAPTREGDDQTYYATAFPIGSLLASSWDVDLVASVGVAQGNEVKEYGVDFLLAPGMNIQRNPLLGRNFEYYSEDPVQSGLIAAAMVNGLESNGIGATIKHYAANNAETNRFFSNSIVDERTMREIYLRGFQIAVEDAQPWALMSSYNRINGEYAAQREDLMTTILRDEWDFEGFAMSDWFSSAIYGFSSETGIADNDSAAKQIKAGNDLIEPGGVKESLEASMSTGVLTESEVDDSVVAILTQALKTPSYQGYAYSNTPDLSSHARLARAAAAESMVLLKNNAATLPLSSGTKVATFGVTQVNTLKGGTGSGDVNAAYLVNIVDGLGEQFTLNTELSDWYTNYFNENKVEETGVFGISVTPECEEASIHEHSELADLIASSATTDAAAVISFGRQAGEGGDRHSGAGDYLLTSEETELLEAVSVAFRAQGKPVIVVLNINGLIDTASWSDHADAILLAYMGGQETGNAIADVLSGAVNPSGKLTQTIPARYADVPSAASFPGVDTNGDDRIDTVYYNEGIYVGYRYYSSFDVPVAYPFGYGLSYTSFDYSNARVVANTLNSDGANGQVRVAVDITNSGSVAGKEAVQVYVSAPEVKLAKPSIELKSFDKTAMLAATASESLSFDIAAQTLASFDPATDQWIIEPGNYAVYVAPSSEVSTVTPVYFTIDEEIIVSQVSAGLLELPEGMVTTDFINVSE